MPPVAPPVTAGADDHALLRRYVVDRDGSAFATVVHRYVPMVYSAAARRVGDRHLAEDVTQAVFVILARKAGSVPGGQPLGAWLLTTTRYAAANALKIESRRRRHEEAAAMGQSETTGVGGGACSADPAVAIVWQDVAGRLDDAVLKLPAADRRAVVLRYFEDRPVREIAAALNCSEGAVKQRLARALEKLRSRLDRATGGALAAVPAAHLAELLASHAVGPAPAGLAAAATSAALAHSAAALVAGATTSCTTLTPHIAKGAMHMMDWTKAKIVASLVAAVTLGGAGGAVTLNRALAQSDAPKQAAPAQPARPKTPASPKAAAKGAKPDKGDNYLGIVTVADAPPVVVETFPKSGASDVDPGTTELKVTFSKDMHDGSWSWAQISDATFPAITAKPRYEADRRTCVLPVKLEPNHTYVIQLNYPPFDNFVDADGRKAVRYLFVFQTRG